MSVNRIRGLVARSVDASLKLFFVARKVGLPELVSKVRDSIQRGGTLMGFVSWLYETYLFHRRTDFSAYQQLISSQAHEWSRRNDVLVIEVMFDGDHLDLCEEVDGTTPVCMVSAGSQEVVDLEVHLDRCRFYERSDLSYLLIVVSGGALGAGAVDGMVAALENQKAGIAYGDEDLIADGRPTRPFFKPGFSLDLLCAHPYLGNVILMSKHACSQVFRERRTLVYENFISELAIAWHRTGGLIARWPGCAYHLTRNSDENPNKSSSELIGKYRDSLIELSSERHAKVSIIIPTRDRLDLLAPCVDGIMEVTTYPDFEVVIVDNGSVEEDTLLWLAAAQDRWPSLTLVRADIEFNWSRLNNLATVTASGDVFVFLNNDVEVITPNWLDVIVRHAFRSDIGAVGPLLLYPDDTIQHAGVVIGIGGFADHVYSGCPLNRDHYHQFVSPCLPRNVLAVTGACMAVAKDKFCRVGGFDENMKICGDIELCLKLFRQGYQNLYEPGVSLYHYESATRRRAPLEEKEMERLMPFVSDFITAGDPFYNPNLSLLYRYPSIYGRGRSR